mmetsp:Transcript_52651/g.132429  ORF Transcript_52651/g.132429 Transcript_52651/m.132429 type:complete len:344 (-) Transcript_52651:73-1104(-)
MSLSRAAAIVRPESVSTSEVEKVADTYYSHFDKSGGAETLEKRESNYSTMVNSFYDLVTSFYEYGWGPSFHFGSRFNGESFDASLARHEMFFALRMKMEKGQRILDLGCGVGGPARCIARFADVHVVGLNNNAYQVERCKLLTQQARLDDRCTFLKGDFMNIPQPDNSFDGAYQMEAACHAPDKVKFYKEVFRVLKPGAYFAGFEWVVTPKYDPENAEHKRIKYGIEEGNGIADLKTAAYLMDCMKEAGFEVLEDEDHAFRCDPETPWYLPLSASYTISGFPHTKLGRTVTHGWVTVLEKLRLAPAGTIKTHEVLITAADALVDGGLTGTATPMHFILCRKPL